MKLIGFTCVVTAVCATFALTTATALDTVYDEHDITSAEQDPLHGEDDIGVAESQDSEVQVYLQPEGDGQLHAEKGERPRTRTRNRNGKRRRRLRKRPRTTTPSFLEVYEEKSHDTLIRPVHHEQDLPTTNDEDMEVSYKRRRPTKRRRRPMRRPQYIDNDYTLDPSLPYSEDQINTDNVHPRNGQRRRRKGSGRKRLRNKQQSTTETHEIQEQENHTDIIPEYNTREENTFDIKISSSEGAHPFESDTQQQQKYSTEKIEIARSTVPTILMTSSAFTPSEITEINHKFQSVSLGQQTYGSYSDYNSPNKYYGVVDTEETLFSSTLSTVPNNDITKTKSSNEENIAKKTSFEEHSKEYEITHQTPKPTTTSTVSEYGNKLSMSVRNNNIEKILKNRKNLFSTSKRLPPTSAVIRRRLRPRLHRNSSSSVLPINDPSSKFLISPTHLNTERKACEGVNCSRYITLPPKNETTPTLHLPVGILATPLVISPQHLIEKAINEPQEDVTNKLLLTTSQLTTMRMTTTTVPVLPTVSTLRTRSPAVSAVPQLETTILPETTLQQTSTQPYPTTTMFTMPATYIETSSDSQITSSQTVSPTLPTTTATFTTSTHPITVVNTTQALLQTERIEEMQVNVTQTLLQTERTEETQTVFHTDVENNQDITYTTEKTGNLKLATLNIPDVKDDILDLLKSENGKARVSRILELRNMTLNELLEHRERGSSQLHLAEIFSDTTPEPTPITKLNTLSSLENVRKQGSSTHDNGNKLKNVHSSEEFNLKHRTRNISINKQRLKSETESNHDTHKPTIVIPNPTLIASQNTFIQFPDDGILNAFPKFISDTLNGKQNSIHNVNINTPEDREGNSSTDRQGKNIPILYNQYSDEKDPQIFESMPQFDTAFHIRNSNNFKIPPYPDWNALLTQNFETSTGIDNVIRLHDDSSKNSETNQSEDVIFVNDGDEAHRIRNRVLGGKITAESGNMDGNNYPERRAFPENAKSTLAVSIAILGLAIFGFLSVLVSCRIQQRRTRLRTKNDILCEHLHGEDLHSSQHSLNPVLKKTAPQNIQSNISSNRHYYLWRTLRKTFQYE